MRLIPILGSLTLLAGCAPSARNQPEPLPAPPTAEAPPAVAPTTAAPAPETPPVAGSGWQYAHWGMSPDQVVAASGGQAVLAKQDSKTNTVFGSTGAEANYSQPPFAFRVFFNFRYGKLTQVTLHPDPKADCTPLINDLTRRFGPPEIKSLYTGITTFYWPNTAVANDIRVFRVPETCSVSYSQHGLVPARAPQGRARFDSLNPGPRQDVEKPARGTKDKGK
jgi:hypothetical protein